MCGGAEGGDGVLLRADVLNEDVRHVVVLYLGGQVDVDLDTVLHVLLLDRMQERVEPLGGAKVADHPREVDLCSARSAFATARRTGHGTLERRVGLELLKLFIRYQIDLRILEQIINKYGRCQPPSLTHEAKGVTPIPAPTSSTVSYFKKSSEAEPNGPSTMTRGSTRFRGGFVLVPTTLPPGSFRPCRSSCQSRSRVPWQSHA